jgi:PAS domain S-box-containing protein
MVDPRTPSRPRRVDAATIEDIDEISLHFIPRIRRSESSGLNVTDAGVTGAAADDPADLRELLAASEERYRLIVERSPDVVFQYVLEPEPRLTYLSPSVEALTGYPVAAFLADPQLVVELAHPDDRSIVVRLLSGEVDPGVAPRLRWVATDGSIIWTEHRVSMLERNGKLVEINGTARDVTVEVEAQAARDRFTVAIERAAESVVMTDIEGRITYVNPAFERTSGYSRAELMGQNPRVLRSGAQSATFYEAMWAALTNGLPWVADFVNKRKDGSLYSEHSAIWAMHDAAGAITGYGAIKRDVTRELEIEAQAIRVARERALIGETIRGLKTDDSVEATARALCLQVARLSGVVGAALYAFEAGRLATPLAFVFTGQRDRPLDAMTPERSQLIEERAASGPWIEPWVDRPRHAPDPFLATMGQLDVGYAPIHHEGTLLGVLMLIAPSSSDQHIPVRESLAALAEFADLAGAVIASGVSERTESARARANVAAIIATSAFHPVFQPVVDLITGRHVGYEALTRFSSAARADLVFAEARSGGLEADLEIATLKVAIDAAVALPQGAWLSVNVSPDLLTGDDRTAEVLAKADRPVVLEVTEHVLVADYGALRAAISRLDPKVRIAVDDAGAGVANFSHIVDLRPDFVKLDIGLVRGVDGDPTRRALIAGLLHFGSESGGQAIAEGVETDDELAALQDLGAELGQGFLLGRPAAASHWAEATAAGLAAVARGDAAIEREETAGARHDATVERTSIAEARRGATARREGTSRQRLRVAADRDGNTGSQDQSRSERDTIANARDDVAAERDVIADDRDAAASERDSIAADRDRAAAGRDDVAGARDALAHDITADEREWQHPVRVRKPTRASGKGRSPSSAPLS